jgi:hypothetical protein
VAGFVVASIIAIAGIFIMGWLVLEVAVGIHREEGRGSLFGIAPGRASRTARRCTGAFARMP